MAACRSAAGFVRGNRRRVPTPSRSSLTGSPTVTSTPTSTANGWTCSATARATGRRLRTDSASVPLARRNLFADRRRLGASVIGVGLAVMLILLLDCLWAGIQQQTTLYTDNVGADLYVLQPGVRDLTAGRLGWLETRIFTNELSARQAPAEPPKKIVVAGFASLIGARVFRSTPVWRLSRRSDNS